MSLVFLLGLLSGIDWRFVFGARIRRSVHLKNNTSHAGSELHRTWLQTRGTEDSTAILTDDTGQNLRHSSAMSDEAKIQHDISGEHRRHFADPSAMAAPSDPSSVPSKPSVQNLLGDTPAIVVAAYASWHGVVAILVISAVILKYRANAAKTLTENNASSDASDDSELPECAVSPQEVFSLKVFVFVSAFFTTLNCTIFIPGSAGIAENAGGGLILSGFLLGAYGIGGIFGSFIVRSLTHRALKSAFFFVCVCMFVGNVAVLLSVLYPHALPWDMIVFFSRVCAGMELGLEYTNQHLIIDVLNPTQDKGGRVALFSYLRLFQYSGAALGPAFSALFTQTGSLLGLPENVLTVGFMCGFALAFAAVISIWFPSVQLPLKPNLHLLESARITHEPDVVLKGWAHFIAFNLITFLRHGMRLAVEAGSVLVFTQSFGFSNSWASCFTSGVMLISIPGNLILGRLIESKGISFETEEAKSFLEQSFLIVQLVASIGLFSMFGGGYVGFVFFICGSGVFYGVNSTITNFLQGNYFEAAVEGHPILKRDRLIIINTVAIQLGMAAGPIASRALNAWSGVGQDTMAFIVVSNLIWQYTCCRVLKA